MSNKSTDDSTVVFVSPEAAVKIERLIAEASETASKLSALQSLVVEYLAAKEVYNESQTFRESAFERYMKAESALRAAVPN